MNFLCISNYFNDLEWLKDYPNPHIIYDKTWIGGVIDNDNSQILPASGLSEKYPEFNVVNGNPNGYNINDYMTFIIDHYENLPDVTVFMKGNTIGRHVSKEYFDRIVNSQCFCPIEDWMYLEKNKDENALTEHICLECPDGKKILGTYAMYSQEGGWMEMNSNWYLFHEKHPSKYFKSFNEFLKFCFVNPPEPNYVRFPPGGNFVVPKQYILKYDKIFYENLRTFTNHTRVPGEGQLIERALYTIWMCNFEVADTMKVLVE